MAIHISFAGSAEEKNLESLADWLRNEPAIRRHAKITLEGARPQPGQMGVPFEAVQLAVDSAFSLANLAIAIASWRRSKTGTPTIIVNGTLVLDSAERDPEKIVEQLRAGGVEDGTPES